MVQSANDLKTFARIEYNYPCTYSKILSNLKSIKIVTFQIFGDICSYIYLISYPNSVSILFLGGGVNAWVGVLFQ